MKTPCFFASRYGIAPLLLALLSALSLPSQAQFAELWQIGDDDGDHDEFEHENDGDEFFYIEDGDYTGTNPAGAFWDMGAEVWNDATPANEIGFKRALTGGAPIINVFFQLDAAESEPGTTFQFDIEFADAEASSLHDIQLSLNGTPFRNETDIVADGATETLLTDTFLGVDVGTLEGENVLTIERTGGSGAWVQIDYLRLQADTSTGGCEDPICQFNGNPLAIAPGGTTNLSWVTDPTATLSIDQGIGSVDALTTSGIGAIQVNPTENTTYTLTSTRGGDVETAQVTVSVGNITSFTANPTQVLPNAATTLSWVVDPAASVSIDQGVGNVDANTVSGAGSIEVNPSATTTYSLTSTRGGDVETATVTVDVNTFVRLWIIGDDDGNQDEFEIENQGDDFFYLENGDYTGLSPAGEVWTTGPEPWSVPIDPLLGFERALTATDPDINIYFQLDAGQANSGTTFLLNAEFADAEGGSSHDLEFRMNGNTFHNEAAVVADGTIEVLVDPTFTGGDVEASEGPNVLTIARTGGTGAWVQFDYVELKADLSTANCDEPICSLAGTPVIIAPGGSSDLIWAVDPTATVVIDQGIGSVDDITSGGIGSVAVAPTQNTTYTLTSTRGGDVDSQQVTITVENIVSFAGDPAVARPGAPVTLSWEVDPSASVTIDQGIGNVDAMTVAGVGSVDVSPANTTTYTLTSTRGADIEQTTFSVVFVDSTLLWLIGEDNNDQNEFEHEADADDFFYVEDGDYTSTSPDDGITFGELWDTGPEPWNDGVGGNAIGFERALTGGDPFMHIFFQLEPEEASPTSLFSFAVQLRAAEGGSMHDIDFSVNGTLFHSVTDVVADGITEVLVTDTFTGLDIGAQAGPNVLTIDRVGGTGAWIQMDYLSLEVQPIVAGAFEITDVELAGGDATITWNSLPGRFYIIQFSTDLKNWEEITDGYPSGGSSTSFTEPIPPAATEYFFRVLEE